MSVCETQHKLKQLQTTHNPYNRFDIAFEHIPQEVLI